MSTEFIQRKSALSRVESIPPSFMARELIMLRFLFLARTAPHKGLPDLLRAFTLLERTDWERRVIGGTNSIEAEEISQLSANLPRVKLLPPISNTRVPGMMRS